MALDRRLRPWGVKLSIRKIRYEGNEDSTAGNIAKRFEVKARLDEDKGDSSDFHFKFELGFAITLEVVANSSKSSDGR